MMKFSEMVIAKIEGGVFTDPLLGLEKQDQHSVIVESITRKLKETYRSKEKLVAFEATIKPDLLQISHANDNHKRIFQIEKEGVMFRIVRAKNFEQDFLADLADSLTAILGVLDRTIWNKVGVSFGIAIPSTSQAQQSTLGRDFLLGQITRGDTRWINQLIPAELQEVDLTLKGDLEGRALTLNLYNNKDQSIVLNLDVKTSEQDAIKGKIDQFLREAYKLFRDFSGPYLESIVADVSYRSAVDFDFLGTGSK